MVMPRLSWRAFPHTCRNTGRERRLPRQVSTCARLEAQEFRVWCAVLATAGAHASGGGTRRQGRDVGEAGAWHACNSRRFGDRSGHVVCGDGARGACHDFGLVRVVFGRRDLLFLVWSSS